MALSAHVVPRLHFPSTSCSSRSYPPISCVFSPSEAISSLHDSNSTPHNLGPPLAVFPLDPLLDATPSSPLLPYLMMPSITSSPSLASRASTPALPLAALPRSEERRVGKESRSRWWPYH